MIAYSSHAARQVKALRQHYEDRDRFEAVATLVAALAEAESKLTRGIADEIARSASISGSTAPRAGLKAGRYWIAYRTSKPPMIFAVFF